MKYIYIYGLIYKLNILLFLNSSFEERVNFFCDYF